ncbi:MAG: PTS transporter subunit EIIC [Elusimicrobia bacterium]|nr:PTS transporter subunit EIIC [Elusimicrobiota bacterium]
MNNTEKAEEILTLAGGKANIAGVACCMTRLRVTVKQQAAVKRDAIKKLDYVQGFVENGNQVQIILGPGHASKIADAFAKITGRALGTASIAYTLKEELQAKNQTPVKIFLKRIANIFIPLIPAFIGCGLIMAVNNILIKFVPGWEATEYAHILAVFGGAVLAGLNIFVGINAAREFGASPMIGGVMAVILTSPALSGIKLLGFQLVPGRGGVIAVLLVVAFSSWLEGRVRKFVPGVLDLFLTPLIVIIVAGTLAIFVLQPAGGQISDWIVLAVNFAIQKGGFVSGFLLASLFLPLVMLGLHQGLAPIHAQLIASYGYTVLFPILAMAGAGQVGAAFAVLFKTKNAKLKKTISSALPVGILGVGEPLIYGVTLPLGKPFLAACIGGGIGGGFVAQFGVGATVIGGISGIPLTPLTTAPVIYLLGILIAYVSGFIISWFMGFEDPGTF